MKKQSVISGVDHVNIRCRDIEESVSFYRDILGFDYVLTRDLRPSSPITSVFMKRDSFVIELANGHDMSLYSKEGRTNHIGMTVEDIHEAYRTLKEQGVKITADIVKVNDYFYCFFIEGPNEEKIEILEYLPETKRA